MKPALSAAAPSRRAVLRSAAAATLAGSALAANTNAAEPAVAPANPAPHARKGRIKQSMVHWCYQKAWKDVDEMAGVAKRLGLQSIELISPEHWPTLKKHGLTCAIAGSHGFARGPNDPKNWDFVLGMLQKQIDAAAAAGVPSVITFTGMRTDGISDEAGMDNCVAAFKKIIGHAERQKVTLCLEHLNSRDDSHPMKGHPGYQGDHLDYCVELAKRVGSERMKVLFDIYHVQIMDGDVIRRIRQHKDYIGHVHTAGNPGRGELDDDQEIHYPPIMRALIEVGYAGYVGQEFIPTRDALAGLEQAVAVCDV